MLIALSVVRTAAELPPRAHRLNCAAIRAALARGKSAPEVAVEFHTSTRLVNLCQHEKDPYRHRFHLVRTPTRIPERTDLPTPSYRTPERPERRP